MAGRVESTIVYRTRFGKTAKVREDGISNPTNLLL
jgi:hypothetical protein